MLLVAAGIGTWRKRKQPRALNHWSSSSSLCRLQIIKLELKEISQKYRECAVHYKRTCIHDAAAIHTKIQVGSYYCNALYDGIICECWIGQGALGYCSGVSTLTCEGGFSSKASVSVLPPFLAQSAAVLPFFREPSRRAPQHTPPHRHTDRHTDRSG